MMPFGKYQGQPFEDVPDSYLRWLLEQAWIFPDLRDEVKTYLASQRVRQAAETAKKKKKARKRKKRYTPEEVKSAIREFGADNRMSARIFLSNPTRYPGVCQEWATTILRSK